MNFKYFLTQLQLQQQQQHFNKLKNHYRQYLIVSFKENLLKKTRVITKNYIILAICDISKDSPMVLDDTIKNQTKSDSLEDFQIDDDEDEEEDFKRQQIEQRELELKNCEEYASEILQHLKELELVNKPKANYIKQQADITSSMRSILVDWLVEVCEEYKLHTETLYLAVNYTDRFLSKMSVLRGKLQLLGTASIYIARYLHFLSLTRLISPPINLFLFK
jgi:ATP-dependent Lon protease